MILDKHFERVVVISLPRSADRAVRAMRELREKDLSAKAAVFRGVDGEISTPSDWWQAGPGAWGCMQSHYRAVQDALLDGYESLLVIEDDCIWQNNAAALAADFLPQVPDDWGQIYLGGQHRNSSRPEWIKPAVLRAKSIHRTHAYAIHRRAMVPFLKHILFAPDYITAKEKSGQCRHVDHQLEAAQQRGDWPVYCPSFWLAGQGENTSLINRREQPEQWWQLPWQDAHRRMPLVICDHRPPLANEMKHLHFGRHLSEAEPWVDHGVRSAPTERDLRRIMEIIASEAASRQRLPALTDLNGGDPKIDNLISRWLGPVIRLSENPDLSALCDFPNSRVIEHPWFNPPAPHLLATDEPTESTEASAARDRRPMVHQVWIGGCEMSPRLAGYCATIERAFPGRNYKLWGEGDMAALAEHAVLPGPLLDQTYPIGLRSDIIRLEILRQYGGVYFDTDFEALRPDLGEVFARPDTFYYGDEQSGRPGNAMMAAGKGHPFVEFYLRRIASSLRVPDDLWDTVTLTGPGKLAECLHLWVVDWSRHEPLILGDARLGSLYAGGSIAGFWRETFYPYHYTEASWASFDPAAFPAAWAAHHWEGGWNRET